MNVAVIGPTTTSANRSALSKLTDWPGAPVAISHVTARESGYGDFVREVVVEPGQVQTVRVAMRLIPGARPPSITAELKLTVEPGRAAVFVDDNYAGHASEFGGALHSLLISPGKHRIKVALPGYQTFETEVGLLAGQKSEVKTELVKGSIEQASSEIKNQK